jgi:hypothetical protein
LQFGHQVRDGTCRDCEVLGGAQYRSVCHSLPSRFQVAGWIIHRACEALRQSAFGDAVGGGDDHARRGSAAAGLCGPQPGEGVR